MSDQEIKESAVEEPKDEGAAMADPAPESANAVEDPSEDEEELEAARKPQDSDEDDGDDDDDDDESDDDDDSDDEDDDESDEDEDEESDEDDDSDDDDESDDDEDDESDEDGEADDEDEADEEEDEESDEDDESEDDDSDDETEESDEDTESDEDEDDDEESDDDSDDDDSDDDDDEVEEDEEEDGEEEDEDEQKAVATEASADAEPAVPEAAEAELPVAEPPAAEAAAAAALGAAAGAATAAAGAVTDVVSPDHAQHLRLLEALLFAGAQALDEKELAERLPNDADVARLLADLAELYAHRGVNLVKVAGGYSFRTASDLAEKLKIEKPVTRKLSRASVETLAIIAYHQPVTRAEIEQVRGVGLSKGTLDLLFEQNWIKPMGRRRAPGKPVTWGTTDFFLEHFGLPSLDDLPGQEELKAAGLLDQRAQPPIFRPEEPDLPLEPTEEEAAEPLAAEETGR